MTAAPTLFQPELLTQVLASGVEVVWVAEAPVPVIVMAYVPAGVADEVDRVKVDELPEVTVVGLKDADAALGRPEAERETDWAAPEVTAVLTVVVVAEPAVTEPDVGLSEMEKSLVIVPPPTMAWEMSHRFVSLDQVDCMAKEPVPVATFADAPWPLLIHAHSSPFS